MIFSFSCRKWIFFQKKYCMLNWINFMFNSRQSLFSSLSSDEHFVDKHRVDLINKVSNVSPILDELLANEVIGKEMSAEISKLPTSYAKIRQLFCCLSSRGSKDLFYELLKKHEHYLMQELKS